MTIERNETDYEQPYATSPTDHILTELQLHGYRPFQDEPDPRPLPEARTLAAAVAPPNSRSLQRDVPAAEGRAVTGGRNTMDSSPPPPAQPSPRHTGSH